MIEVVIKRNGEEEVFESKKIKNAIKNAFLSTKKTYVNEEVVNNLTEQIVKIIDEKKINKVEEIQDVVERVLMVNSYFDVAKNYITYRYEHAIEREKKRNLDEKMLSILRCENIQNSNANVDEFSFSGRKYECAGLTLKQLALDKLIRKEVSDAFRQNYIYIHDLDSYGTGNHNCLFIDFKKLFTDGFSTRNGDVRTPKSLSTAMQQVAVIMQCQSQVQYGGCASMHIDFDLAPFVAMSFKKYFKDGLKYLEGFSNEKIEETLKTVDIKVEDQALKAKFPKVYNYAMELLEREGTQSSQGLYHNLNTLESRAGSQLPFTSLNFGRDTSPEGRLVTKWLLHASIDGIGKYHRTPIFPITIFQLKKGVNENPGDPNYDLFQLALESTSKRLYPNYVNCDCANAHEDEGDPDTYMCTMGCRTLIGVDRNGMGNKKIGRGNISPITIILPKIAIEYGICQGKRTTPDIDGFWKKLDEILKITEQGLLDRFYYIAGQNPKSAPFMYDNQTARGADKCVENVFEMAKHGTNAIGMLGLAECLEALFGKNQVDTETRKFGVQIVKHIYDYAKDAAERSGLNFSCYFTPAEGACFATMQKLKDEYGSIPRVTENEYLTNSIHVPVWEEVSIFEKIDIEREFTDFGTAGCITYVEFDSKIRHNTKAIEQTIKYALSKGITYLAINFPIDTCLDCGLNEEIPGNCMRCGSSNIEHLARVTGYLSTDVSHFNKGKQQEVSMRFKHSRKTSWGDY